MARALRIQYPGAFYHVTCRGNQRRKIFLDTSDQYHFLTQLTDSLETYKVCLYAYVLMGNHFHLLVQTVRANLSEFMRRFNICYTGWFNHHHKTSGHLYQGRYKAFLIDADNYLLELTRYIHLNPVRSGALRKANHNEKWRYLQKYQWSSLPGYLAEKKCMRFIDYNTVLAMLGDRRCYREYLHDGLRGNIEDPFEDVHYQTILGDKDFVALVKNKFLQPGSLRDQPSYRGMKAETVTAEVVMQYVSDVFGASRDTLCKRRADGCVRGVCAELLYRYSGLSLRQIGQILGGIDYGGVHQLRRRLQLYMDRDKSIKDKYQMVERSINSLCSK